MRRRYLTRPGAGTTWKRRSDGKWRYTGQNILRRPSYHLGLTASRRPRMLAEDERPLERGMAKARPDVMGPYLGEPGCSTGGEVVDGTERARPMLSLSESQQSIKVANGASEEESDCLRCESRGLHRPGGALQGEDLLRGNQEIRSWTVSSHTGIASSMPSELSNQSCARDMARKIRPGDGSHVIYPHQRPVEAWGSGMGPTSRCTSEGISA